MDVEIAVLADFASVTADQKLNILGIFQEINPPQGLPFVFPQFFIVISIATQDSDIGTSVPVRIDGYDTENTKILTLGADLTVGLPPRTGRTSYLNQVIGLAGLTFNKYGKYLFRVFLGDAKKAEIPLYVNEPLPTNTNYAG